MNKKRRKFVEEYLKCWNASEAARRANYAHPAQQGHRLLRNVQIRDEIKHRLAEVAMEADEVLVRLSEQARGTHSDYINPDGTIDLAKLISEGKAHLVKGTRWDSKDNLIVEFYDAQSALVHIGKAHGIFTDRIDMTTKGEKLSGGLTDEQRMAGFMALYDSVRARVLAQTDDGKSDMGSPARTTGSDVSSSS